MNLLRARLWYLPLSMSTPASPLPQQPPVHRNSAKQVSTIYMYLYILRRVFGGTTNHQKKQKYQTEE